MTRTLILNISAEAQTLPAAYGGFSVAVGHGRVVSDESSLVVTELGGFASMDGKWAVSAISTDTALGDIDVAANGVALLATFVPSGGGGGGSVTWNTLSGKPTFATVATSGSYTDLINKPSFADVATSGDYTDLINTPSVPVASNATPNAVSATGAAGVGATFARGDHQHAHGNQAGGALHSVATTIAAGFMSAADKAKLDSLSDVATSGEYSALSNTPSLSTVALTGAYSDLSGTPVLADVATSGAYADLSGKPSLSTVATSGAYADLSGAPSLATVATSGAYADLSGRPSLAAVATSGSFTDLSNKPTKTYDIATSATGSLAVGTTVLKFYSPKALTLSALNQGGGATVKVQVDGADITYPKSVSVGQVISAVVTVSGVDSYLTISGVEA